MKLSGGIEVGAILPTTHGDVVVLDAYDWDRVQVCFLDHTCVVTTRADQLRRGNVKNPMKPSVHGIGFIGVGQYYRRKKGDVTHIYGSWRHMIERVYKPRNERIVREYTGTSVDVYWHNFQNFAKWYEEQISKVPVGDFTWHLDKDLLIPGNRIYSPATCCVIPEAMNSLLLDCFAKRGDLPLGVSRHGKKFRALVGRHGENKVIGTYNTIPEAQFAYWNEKFQSIQYTTIMYWNYLPESLAMRLINFGWEDAFAYYGDDARLWADNEGMISCM